MSIEDEEGEVGGLLLAVAVFVISVLVYLWVF